MGLRPAPRALRNLRGGAIVALEAVRSACHLCNCPSPAPCPAHPLLAIDLAWHWRKADLLHRRLILLVVVQVGGEPGLISELAVTINTATLAAPLHGQLLPGRLPQPRLGGRLALAPPCSTSQTLAPLLRRTPPASPLGRGWTCLRLILTLGAALPRPHYARCSATTLFHIGEELGQSRPFRGSPVLSRVFLGAGGARLSLHHEDGFGQLVSQSPSQP